MAETPRSIQQTITIAAPPERVFRALTDAAELVRWFPTTARSDARTGGAYAFSFDFVEAKERDHATAGEYLDVTPNRRVAYTWPAGHAQELPTEVRFTLAPDGGSTEVTLVHSGWMPGTEESRTEHEMGWGLFLQNLKSWLERGQDERASKMGMKTAVAV